MGKYCLYLRKSRADAEAEARGEGETLARHEHTLLELAKKRELPIVHIYREIVSGDSIAARPQMQQLLQDLSEDMYDGVLVMEIERLARGDTIDQGIVAQAFRESNTKIVTPVKTYDPNNEFDEEYFEFSLFMSRREYKTIKRRMQAGRVASVKEGNYIGTNPPYGYRKINPEPKVRTLEIVPEEAEAVRMMFDLYLSGKGMKAIATRLNQLQILPRKSPMWEKVSVRKILKNPIYAGKIQWNTKRDGIIMADGLHEPIISYETFQAVQEKMERNPAAAVAKDYTVKNYYHNILYCANCGHQMRRRPSETGNGYMLCLYQQCRGKTCCAPIDTIDEAVLTAIQYRLHEMIMQSEEQEETNQPAQSQENTKRELEAALTRIQKQKNKLHTLLETDVYSVETFLERSKILEQQKQELEQELAQLQVKPESQQIPPNQAVVWLQYVIDNFSNATAEEKNKMLLRVIRRIDYSKTTRMCKNKRDSDMKLHVDFL